MKLEKAIEVLTLISTNLRGSLGYAGIDAVKLGIEALKRYKVIRANFGKLRQDRLPGETEE